MEVKAFSYNGYSIHITCDSEQQWVKLCEQLKAQKKTYEG